MRRVRNEAAFAASNSTTEAVEAVIASYDDGARVSMTSRPRVYVYIDGYNLYYGSLRGTPYKWLDPWQLAANLLPDHHIARVWYFTARINGSPDDPDQPTRQDAYIRAIKASRRLTVIEGFYLENAVVRRLVDPPDAWNTTATVWDSEEKGSDVNIATALLLDAFDRERGVIAYDLAVLISNDSDLVWPIHQVKKKFALKVGVFKPERPEGYPYPVRPDAKKLARYAAWYRKTTEEVLRMSQMPEEVPDPTRPGSVISKPDRW